MVPSPSGILLSMTKPKGVLIESVAKKLKLQRIRPGLYRGIGMVMIEGKETRVEVEVEEMEGWPRSYKWASRADLLDETNTTLWTASDSDESSTYRKAKEYAEFALSKPWKYYGHPIGYAFA